MISRILVFLYLGFLARVGSGSGYSLHGSATPGCLKASYSTKSLKPIPNGHKDQSKNARKEGQRLARGFETVAAREVSNKLSLLMINVRNFAHIEEIIRVITIYILRQGDFFLFTQQKLS